MHQLKYTENHNGKLFADCWGDIRVSDIGKFYAGNVVEVYLRKYYLGTAEVIGNKEFCLKRLTDTMTHLNSGKSTRQQVRLLSFYYQNAAPLTDDTIMMHIVLKWKTRNMEVQSNLMEDWWRSKQEQFPYLSAKENQFL